MRNMWNLVCSVVPVWAVCGLACLAQAQQPEDPYAHHTVLIETFVVELTTEAVREAGGDIVGRDPSGISISKLLWALRDEDNGQVVSGLKTNTGTGRQAVLAQEEITQHYLVKTTRPGPDGPQQLTERRPYTASRSLNIEWFNIVNADSVRLTYSYVETTVIPYLDDSPPTITKTTYSGSVTATSGVPVIAGSSQDEDTVRLLVFVVTLMASAEPAAGEKHATARDENSITAFLNEIIPTVQFSHNIPPVEALRQLGRTYEVNIIPSQKVSEFRTLFPVFDLYDVTFDEILQAIPGDYRYVIDGKFIRVYTAEEFEEIEKDTPRADNWLVGQWAFDQEMTTTQTIPAEITAQSVPDSWPKEILNQFAAISQMVGSKFHFTATTATFIDKNGTPESATYIISDRPDATTLVIEIEDGGLFTMTKSGKYLCVPSPRDDVQVKMYFQPIE